MNRVSILATSCFLETGKREQQKYENTLRTQTFVNNKENDLRNGIKFENREKNKNNFFIKQNISFVNKNIIFFYFWKSRFLGFQIIQLPQHHHTFNMLYFILTKRKGAKLGRMLGWAKTFTLCKSWKL